MSSLARILFNTDHRAIARNYFGLSLLSVLAGAVLSLAMRYHLIDPLAPVGGVTITPELYLQLMTLHATLMVFFVLTLAPLNAFGNLVLPRQLGAQEMAFPRLNLLGWWITVASFLLLIAAAVSPEGGPLSGWTAYPPLSAIGALAGPGEGLGQSLWFLSIAVFSVGSTLNAVNMIATVIDCRAPGMSFMRMPLTCWNWFVTSILSLLSFPVLLAAALLIMLDRTGGTSFFVPGGLQIADDRIAHTGGSPLLWQHLFWFFGHPEVYIAILPGMGIVSHLISVYTGRPVFGHRSMIWSTVAIAVLGLLVWGHHMFISGLNPYSAIAFSVLTMAIAVPSAIKTLNWIATLWGARPQLPTAMLFSLGFVSIFVTGGLSGLFLAQPQIDAYFHDTYFVVAHFHLIMGIAALFSIFAATFHWYPAMFRRRLNERLGKVHFYLTFVLAYSTFLPMHFVGFAGNPRRYSDFTTFDFLAPLMPLQRWITWSAFALATAQLVFLANLILSIRGGPVAESGWAEEDTEVCRR